MPAMTPIVFERYESEDQRHAARDLVTEAFVEAVQSGIDPGQMAEEAMSCALRELVALRGEAAVARQLEAMSVDVEIGAFSAHMRRN